MHNYVEKLAKVTSHLKEKKLQDYEVISIIENGAFDMCFKVRDKLTKTLYIWRGINYDVWNDEKEGNLEREMNILRKIQHPHMLEHYDYLLNYESKSIFIVMQYMENDNLEQLIESAGCKTKRVAESFIWRVFQQICQALQIYDNKMKQHKSNLKLDITTRNILLDVKNNSIKLTDFGINRLVESHESSIEKKCKSTSSSLGCLIYELCTLQPCPHQLEDFTEAIFIENSDNKLWQMYSKDLRDLIVFLLQENKHNNNIEKVLKHPLATQYLTTTFETKSCLVNLDETKTEDCQVMDPNASIVLSEQNSIIEEYGGQKLLSVDNMFTPDLRAELFYSARRKVFSKFSNSEGQLYESICFEENSSESNTNPWREKSPSKLSHNVFEKVLLGRLHAIRVHERLLQQQEQNFKIKERELYEKERRLYNLETELELRKKQLELREEVLSKNEEKLLISVPQVPMPPPIPPRKPTNNHDDTYCSIDQDSPTQQPRTIAKLNLAALRAPKSFPTLRKVTFQSPKKFISYNIDAIKVVTAPNARSQKTKSTEDVGQSSDNSTTTYKRKSILSIFGLSRSSKDVSAPPNSTANRNMKSLSNFNVPAVPLMEQQQQQQKQQKSTIVEAKVLARCETSILNNMWTKEHKRAAFDMLAAMNSAESRSVESSSTTAVHSKMRQSIREKGSSLQRHRLHRRSMITTNAKKRDNLLI